jgi:Cys-tRNA(Pro)/Cys-tRNA(Cys) deacylase
MPTRSTPALRILAASRVPVTVHEYELPDRPPDGRHAYGREAAVALGIDEGRIFKTLVVRVDDQLVLAVVPVDGEVDLRALAGVLSGRRAVLAEAADAERATGYVVGGISPIGGRRRLPVVVDVRALELDSMLVSAGRRGLQVELSPGSLVAVTAATVAGISRR